MWQGEFYIQWTIQYQTISTELILQLKWYEDLEAGFYGTYNELNKLVNKEPRIQVNIIYAQ